MIHVTPLDGVPPWLCDVFIFSIILLTALWFHSIRVRKEKPRMPPGPRSFPLVGNLLLLLGPNLHHRFAKYSRTYGPIMKLRLGTKLCIVISSPAIAKEVYKDNDPVFANHDQTAASTVVSYGGSNLVRSPYGPTWRMLHRVFHYELLNSRVLDDCSGLQRQEVGRMVQQLEARSGSPVDVGEQVFATFLDLLTGMLWGGRLESEAEGVEFRQAIIGIVGLMGRPNISDYFPVLARFDLQGIEKQMKKRVSWLDRIYEGIIDEKVRLGGEEGKGTKDLLSNLLKIRDDGDPNTPLTTTHVKGLIMDIMVGGTTLTSAIVEWVMVELMQRPEIKKRARDELEATVGVGSTVEEFHVPKLHYLRAVIKETLRLHPMVPLLVPRVPSRDCIVGGYVIPAGACVVTNVWAIHTNPAIWDDPLEFRPERFMVGATAAEGREDSAGGFRFFPFGAGRRRCPGLPLVEWMLPVVIGTLLHLFEWQVPEGMELDLSERSGVALTKARPFFAVPMPRLSNPSNTPL